MSKPDIINFTGLSIDPNRIKTTSLRQIPSRDWVRVVCTVPNSYGRRTVIDEWLAQNCKGQYSTYRFSTGNSYTEQCLIARFEDRSDAIMFKLSGVYANDAPTL